LSRPPTLSDEQKAIIDENINLYPAQIKKLPGMENKDVTRHVIRAYQKRVQVAEEPDDKAVLVTLLTQYMNAHGLPSRFHGAGGVTGFIAFLRE
jgi:hypothetical protein